MTPRLSIIIPTHNNAEVLERALDAVGRAGHGNSQWECIVVDNSDDDQKRGTESLVRGFGRECVRYEPMRPLGLMEARHRGASVAQGEIISFIDDDSIVGPRWVEGVCAAFAQEAVLVGGPIRPIYETEPPRWLDDLSVKTPDGSYLGYLSLMDFGTKARALPTTLVWGCNYSVRRDLFYRVGGSHPDFVPEPWKRYEGDGETALSIRIAAAGHEALYHPDCAIGHIMSPKRWSLDYLRNRAFYCGVGRSFAETRAEHGMGPDRGVPLEFGPLAGRRRRWRLLLETVGSGRPVRTYRRLRRARRALSVPAERIAEDLSREYARGQAFHYAETRSDKAFLDYVLRSDYLTAPPPFAGK